jgi:hypothetical protein
VARAGVPCGNDWKAHVVVSRPNRCIRSSKNTISATRRRSTELILFYFLFCRKTRSKRVDLQWWKNGWEKENLEKRGGRQNLNWTFFLPRFADRHVDVDVEGWVEPLGVSPGGVVGETVSMAVTGSTPAGSGAWPPAVPCRGRGRPGDRCRYWRRRWRDGCCWRWHWRGVASPDWRVSLADCGEGWHVSLYLTIYSEVIRQSSNFEHKYKLTFKRFQRHKLYFKQFYT